MSTISVSPAILRKKAQRIRNLADQGLAQHYIYWSQMNNTKDRMPHDLRISHEYANDPWHQAVETHYKNYYELARSMEAAADLYEAVEGDVKADFTLQ
jgi:uncharacterized protein YukE